MNNDPVIEQVERAINLCQQGIDANIRKVRGIKLFKFWWTLCLAFIGCVLVGRSIVSHEYVLLVVISVYWLGLMFWGIRFMSNSIKECREWKMTHASNKLELQQHLKQYRGF